MPALVEAARAVVDAMERDMEVVTERMSAMSTSITMRLGPMMVGLAGIVFAALKLA